MTDQKTEQKPADHKAIREALEADPYLTANVAKDDLRALLADLDAMRGCLRSLDAMGGLGQTAHRMIDTALKGAEA